MRYGLHTRKNVQHGYGLNKVDLTSMNNVELTSMNNVDLTSMNKVELASMNKVVLVSMNNAELTSMNKVELTSMNKVELANMSYVVNNVVQPWVNGWRWVDGCAVGRVKQMINISTYVNKYTKHS